MSFDEESYRKEVRRDLGDAADRAIYEIEGERAIARIHAIDQADAANGDLAESIARFYTTVAASGMRKKDAGDITRSFAAMATGQHFGVNVAEAFGAGPIYDVED